MGNKYYFTYNLRGAYHRDESGEVVRPVDVRTSEPYETFTDFLNDNDYERLKREADLREANNTVENTPWQLIAYITGKELAIPPAGVPIPYPPVKVDEEIHFLWECNVLGVRLQTVLYSKEAPGAVYHRIEGSELVVYVEPPTETRWLWECSIAGNMWRTTAHFAKPDDMWPSNSTKVEGSEKVFDAS